MARGDYFSGYKEEYIYDGLFNLDKGIKDEISKYCYLVGMLDDADIMARFFDYYYDLYFATGDHSSLKLHTGGPNHVEITLFDKTFTSKEFDRLKDIDIVNLRDVIMVFDYCGTELDRISKEQGLDYAKKSELGKLMTKLRGYIDSTLDGKIPERLDVDFREVIGEETYKYLQDQCRYKGLKAKLIAEGKIPKESYIIKYPERYSEFEAMLPEILEAYASVYQEEKKLKDSALTTELTEQKLTRHLYEAKKELDGLKVRAKDRKALRGKTKQEKDAIKHEIEFATLKGEAKLANARYELAKMEEDSKETTKRIETLKAEAIRKIAKITTKKAYWSDYQQ